MLLKTQNRNVMLLKNNTEHLDRNKMSLQWPFSELKFKTKRWSSLIFKVSCQKRKRKVSKVKNKFRI